MEPFFHESRIEPLRFSLLGSSHTVDILRDDLIHPLVSGNKWRKLKYIVEHVRDSGKTKIVTFGGAYSNHLVAAAVAGKHFGIETIAFVRGDEPREPNAYEITCAEHGMHLIHVSRTAYKDKIGLFESHFGQDPQAEFVGEGGMHPQALIGCAEIVFSLDKPYDYIVLALGTGTTMLGIVKGISELQLPTKVIGISSLKGNIELNRMMEAYPETYWSIEHGYHRGRYASNDEELETFITQFYAETGIQLEFVYTAKMMMALTDLMNSGKIEKGKRILCIHTGGLPGLLHQ